MYAPMNVHQCMYFTDRISFPIFLLIAEAIREESLSQSISRALFFPSLLIPQSINANALSIASCRYSCGISSASRKKISNRTSILSSSFSSGSAMARRISRIARKSVRTSYCSPPSSIDLGRFHISSMTAALLCVVRLMLLVLLGVLAHPALSSLDPDVKLFVDHITQSVHAHFYK